MQDNYLGEWPSISGFYGAGEVIADITVLNQVKGFICSTDVYFGHLIYVKRYVLGLIVFLETF